MKLLKIILPVFFLISFVDCYSQQKKVNVSATTPVVVTSSATTSDVLENPKSFFALVDSDNINDALELLGINIYSIKLPIIHTKKYNLIVYTDNYIQSKETVKKKNEFSIINERNEPKKNFH